MAVGDAPKQAGQGMVGPPRPTQRAGSLPQRPSKVPAPKGPASEEPPAAGRDPGPPDPKKAPGPPTLKKDAKAPAPEKGGGTLAQPSASSQGPEGEGDRGGGPAEGGAGLPAALPQQTATAEANVKKPKAEQGASGSQDPGEPRVGKKAAEGQAAARRGSPAFLHSPSCPAIISSSEKPLAKKPPSEASELTFEGVPMTHSPTDPRPAKAEEGKNILAESQKEVGEKTPGQVGQAKVQGDTSKGIEFQAVPSEKSERHHAIQTGWEDLAAGRQPGALPPPPAAAETSAPPRNHIPG
ncbi:Myosin light chain kinase 2, skeletal/cardiac muscle [Saguinus oedipus]|uniref:Myosin light chain kinase 2, skeletal/cardiac muscle n=1 Tax=Saguinus oedipus TaxID=9490 RepID=A0ABQ9VKL6_SAGOE|nr:Myosin light chain kinase 2, skeletal/cardiac muscle [Saguinus oedipus]